MRYVFDGPAAGAEYTWIVDLPTGSRSFHRHDEITGDDFSGASPETKRNIEGLVSRGILTTHEDEQAPAEAPQPADKTEDVPATEPGKE
jgi:hypothetical protein